MQAAGCQQKCGADRERRRPNRTEHIGTPSITVAIRRLHSSAPAQGHDECNRDITPTSPCGRLTGTCIGRIILAAHARKIRSMTQAAPSRRTVKLPQSLNCGLTVYALAPGAAGIGVLAVPEPAQAQIVYTPAHIVLEAGSTVNLDLNHDGITDAAIVNRVSKGRSGHTFSARASLLAIPGKPPYGGVARRYYNAAGAFRPGQKIGNSRSFDSQIDLMCTAYLFLDYYFGSWMSSATNRYLGVRFTLNGK